MGIVFNLNAITMLMLTAFIVFYRSTKVVKKHWGDCVPSIASHVTVPKKVDFESVVERFGIQPLFEDGSALILGASESCIVQDSQHICCSVNE